MSEFEIVQWLQFQSTLSMRRATSAITALPFASLISIHALHEESDLKRFRSLTAAQFQSTLSMRRATLTPTIRTQATPHFNPRSP